MIPVSRGTTNEGQIFRVTNTGTITIGTTSLTFDYALEASSMSFTQSGSGAVSRSMQEKAREAFAVSDFDTTGDGVADDSAEAKAAIDAALAATLAGSSGVYGVGASVGTGQTVSFPKGVYKVSAALTADTNQALNYLHITGDDAIIVASAGVTVFGGVGYDVKFSRLIFRDGAVAINGKTNNVNSSTIDIDKVEFHNQTTACVALDSNSASTVLNVTRCKIRQAGGGYVGKFESGDRIHISDSWISCASAVGFYNNGHLTVRDCMGVPGTDMVAAGGRWFDNYNVLDVHNFRMGGESGGAKSAVRNYAPMDTTNPVTPTRVAIENCPLYVDEYVIEFYELPNVVRVVGNHGMNDSLGFYFDSTLTAADFRNFQALGSLDIRDNYTTSGAIKVDLRMFANTSTAGDIGIKVFNAMLARDNIVPLATRERVTVAEIVGSSGIPNSGSGWTAGTTTNVSIATVADSYGVNRREITATADGGVAVRRHDTYIDPAVVAYGTALTLTQEVEVNSTVGSVVYHIEVGGSRKYFSLSNGRHLVSLPFVYLNDTGSASTTYDRLEIGVTLRKNTDVVKLGRLVLVKGFQAVRLPLEIEGTTAPAAYTEGVGYDEGYFRGDRYYRPGVAACVPQHEVCTTAGTTGVWSAVGTPPSVNTTVVGNAGTGEDNLQTFSLPASALYAAGKGVRITAWGTTANNANAKTLKLYFGSLAIITQTLTTNQASEWEFNAEVFSTGTDAQDYKARFFQDGATPIHNLSVGTHTQDDGAAITIKCTGEATSNSDITQEGMIVELLN